MDGDDFLFFEEEGDGEEMFTDLTGSASSALPALANNFYPNSIAKYSQEWEGQIHFMHGRRK